MMVEYDSKADASTVLHREWHQSHRLVLMNLHPSTTPDSGPASCALLCRVCARRANLTRDLKLAVRRDANMHSQLPEQPYNGHVA